MSVQPNLSDKRTYIAVTDGVSCRRGLSQSSILFYITKILFKSFEKFTSVF